MVGPAVCAAAVHAEVEVIRTSLHGDATSIAADLCSSAALEAMLDAVNPDRIVHLAAIARPAVAAGNLALARRLNTTSTEAIADWCRRRGRWLMFASTDQVFDGTNGPYVESDPTCPCTVYGRTKADAEQAVLRDGGSVARIGWVLNDRPGGRADFVRRSLDQLRIGGAVAAVDDEFRTPISATALGRLVVRLAALDFTGVLHAAGPVHVTPYELVMRTAAAAGVPTTGIERTSSGRIAPFERPRDVRLDTSVLQRLLAEPRRHAVPQREAAYA